MRQGAEKTGFTQNPVSICLFPAADQCQLARCDPRAPPTADLAQCCTELDHYAFKRALKEADKFEPSETPHFKFPKPLVASFMLLAVCSTIGEPVKSANAQELTVPCYAFYRNFLGQWIATQRVPMYTRIGLMEVQPGQVGNPVAEVLHAQCRGADTGGE